MKSKPTIPGPLYIISGLLVISAFVRVPVLATEALALGNPTSEEAGQASGQGETQKLDILLKELRAREEAIKQRESQLVSKEKQLDKLEARVSKKIEELTAAEENLRQVLAIADSAAEDDVARLTTVYENMKPKDAAGVFEKMPPAFASGFLSRMRPDAAASIMAGLNPDTAYAISVVLAGRHVEAEAQ